MINHTKAFGVYHWDTFDNETLLISEHNSLEDARNAIAMKYGKRLMANGADVVDIVDLQGTVIESHKVG